MIIAYVEAKYRTSRAQILGGWWLKTNRQVLILLVVRIVLKGKLW